MKQFFLFFSALTGGVVAGLAVGVAFHEPIRRKVKSAAKAVALSDAYQAFREDLDDVRAEVATELIGRQQ